MEGDDRPPRWVIRATLAVLLLMAVSTAASVETWPLGPWELFSRTRGPVQVSYIAKSVDGDTERQIDFSLLSAEYAGAHQILGGFTQLPADEKDAICRAWDAGLREAGEPGTGIRIYRLVRRLRLDGRPPSRHEIFVHECWLGGSL